MTVGADDPTPTDDDVVVLDENAEEVLVRLDVVLAEADQALADDDLGLYQAKVEEAEELIDDAVDRLGLDVAEPNSATDAEGEPVDADGFDRRHRRRRRHRGQLIRRCGVAGAGRPTRRDPRGTESRTEPARWRVAPAHR